MKFTFKSNRIIYIFSIIILAAMSILAANYFILAWTEPTANPPDGFLGIAGIQDCVNPDEILQWDGSAWQCALVSGGGGGVGTLLETPIVIFNGDGGGSGTFDVAASSLPAGTTEVLLYGIIDDGNSANDRSIRYKYPSQSTWKYFLRSYLNAAYPNSNTSWIPLENGELDWSISDASQLQLYSIEIHGYKEGEAGGGASLRTDCDDDEVLQWDGDSWECAVASGGGTVETKWEDICVSHKTTAANATLFCAADEYLVDAMCSDSGDSGDCTITYGVAGTLEVNSGAATHEASILCCKDIPGGGGGDDTVSMITDWPDAIKCEDGGEYEVLYFKMLEGTTMHYGSVGRNSITQIKFSSVNGDFYGADNSDEIIGYLGCKDKNISEIPSFIF